jgi:hypothetical protein|tara:strand:- start:1690 stop:1968 length:279 start_codon:yes stop_codon:yes gene_type:complete
MNYLVQPSSIVSKAMSIDSFKSMVTKEKVENFQLFEMAIEIAEEWTNSWDEGDGFGSSDGTYLLKDFIDSVIGYYAEGYKTIFNPYLMITKV